MAISQKQIMDRAYRIAVGSGVDPHNSQTIDAQFVFEDAFPIALREAVKKGIEGDPGEAATLKRTYVLALTSGSATLPDTVLEEFLDQSTIIDPNSGLNSYQEVLSDYYSPANPQLGYYALQGSTILYREPNDDAGIFNSDITLVTAGMPDIPPVITTDLGIATELAERTIQILAAMARGASPIQAAGGVSD